MKRITIGKTYDNDCTSVGWLLEVSKDKTGWYRIIATYRTRWQGGKNEASYRSNIKYNTITEAMDAGKTFLKNYQEDEIGYIIENKWENLSTGYLVQ